MKAITSGRRFSAHCLVSVPLLLASLHAYTESPRCSDWAAQLVSLEGAVSWRAEPDDQWQPAQLHDYFCYGDSLRVEQERAALRLANETLVRLKEHSTVRLQPAEGSFWLELLQGAGHFLSRTPKDFTVKAPYLNAAVDGTEFIVSHSDRQDRVAVLEGKVLVQNEQGQLHLSEGESASAAADTAPTAVPRVRLRDAADWTLYFPPLVVHSLDAGPVKRLLDSGNYHQAYRRLQQEDSDAHALLAALALALGRTEEADAWLAADDNSADAAAVRAMMTLFRGDAESALQQSTDLAASEPESLSAMIALGYALQGNAMLDESLAVTEEAHRQYPNSLFLQARLAELSLSAGDISRAEGLLAQALASYPANSQLLTLAGFTDLNRLAAKPALVRFDAAITSQSGNPLSHWGRGLALVQQGKITEGRQALELATLLDPTNSTLRSYLGKLYAEAHRDDWAATQFQMAQQLDRNDPTPWLYSAQLYQAQNRVPEALQLVEAAIQKNDNRALYRSRFLLDSDAAAQSANQARIYQLLGFEARAQTVAAMAVVDNPTDFAAQQALALAYAKQPGAQLLRADAALQSKLLQPVSANALSLGIGQTGVQTYPWLSPSQMGLHEYSSLFNPRGISGYITPMVGSQSNRGLEWQLQLNGERTALVGGQHQQHGDGYRLNNGLDVELIEVALHHQATDHLKLFVEHSRRHELYGDLTSGISSPNFDESVTRKLEFEANSLGLSWQAAANQTLLAHATRKKGDTYLSQDVAVIQGPGDHKKLDLAYFYQGNALDWQLGHSFESFDATNRFEISLPFPPFQISDTHEEETTARRAYFDVTSREYFSARIMAGVGATDFHWSPSQVTYDSLHRSYKLGVSLQPTQGLALTLAKWNVLAERYPRSGRLESAHIFDLAIREDIANFSPDDGRALKLTWRNGSLVTIAQVRRSKYNELSIYTAGDSAPRVLANPIQRTESSANLSYLLNSRFSLYSNFRLRRDEKAFGQVAPDRRIPVETELQHASLGAHYFFGKYWSGELSLNWVEQEEATYEMTLPNGQWLLDRVEHQAPLLNVGLNFKLPRRAGHVSVEGYNLLDKPLSIYSGHLQAGSESNLPTAPVFAPRRAWVSKLTLVF